MSCPYSFGTWAPKPVYIEAEQLNGEKTRKHMPGCPGHHTDTDRMLFDHLGLVVVVHQRCEPATRPPALGVQGLHPGCKLLLQLQRHRISSATSAHPGSSWRASQRRR